MKIKQIICLIGMAIVYSFQGNAASIVLNPGENITLLNGGIEANGSILATKRISVVGDNVWLDVGLNNVDEDHGGGNVVIGYDNGIFSSCDYSYANVVAGISNNVSSWTSLVSGTTNRIISEERLSSDSLVAGKNNTLTHYSCATILGNQNTMQPAPNSQADAAFGAVIGGYNSLQADTGWIIGVSNNATGLASATIGWNLVNHTHSAIVMGVSNESVAGSAVLLSETSPALVLGNGSSSTRSNAITTLKNGQTTLTNKEWKANSSAPLEDPSPTTDSGGNALVVEGHTVLKGKVIIEQAQGDISMGIYQ